MSQQASLLKSCSKYGSGKFYCTGPCRTSTRQHENGSNVIGYKNKLELETGSELASYGFHHGYELVVMAW